MNSFKDIAYQILHETGKSLHSKEITKIALNRGWLKTVGKTPEFTMNAQLIVDINAKKEKSRFIKTAPSTLVLIQKERKKLYQRVKRLRRRNTGYRRIYRLCKKAILRRRE